MMIRIGMVEKKNTGDMTACWLDFVGGPFLDRNTIDWNQFAVYSDNGIPTFMLIPNYREYTQADYDWANKVAAEYMADLVFEEAKQC